MFLTHGTAGAAPPGQRSPGQLLAAVLAGAWRSAPSPLEMSAQELDVVTPRLIGSGAGALGWWRVRHSDLRTSTAALQLQQVYRQHTLRAALHERDLAQVITRLRAGGVESCVVKGWAIAQLYLEPGLRPHGDIDLCVRPEEYAAATAILQNWVGHTAVVDLHQGFAQLDVCSLDELYARSQLVRLGELDVRVLGLEDHLRLLCVHLLRHGAWRPLWLCDVAVALESRPSGFDWDRCLGRNRRRADWVACTIGLAHQLLDVPVDDTPVAWRARHLPRWLVPAVLEQWKTPCTVDHLPPEPFATTLHHPARVPKALYLRWPDPIVATIDRKGPFNALPRLPFQLGAYLMTGLARLVRFASRARRRSRILSAAAASNG